MTDQAAETMLVTAMDQVPALVEMLYHRPGPTFALAKIALSRRTRCCCRRKTVC